MAGLIYLIYEWVLYRIRFVYGNTKLLTVSKLRYDDIVWKWYKYAANTKYFTAILKRLNLLQSNKYLITIILYS